MPAKHKYKCLNYDLCPGDGTKSWNMLFIAMNAPTPTCCCCGTMNIEDWGECCPYEKIGPFHGARSAGTNGAKAKSVDSTLNRLAAAHGLTNINNRDGQPAKMAQDGPDTGTHGTMNVLGVQVPINDGSRGEPNGGIVTRSGATGAAPVTVPTSGRFPGKRSIPTQVIAKHEGKTA